METKANYVLIGAFTILGFVGILVFLMWFAKIQVNRQFAYYDIYFTDVTGLSVASEVTFAGLGVGKVVDMVLADDDNGVVRVRVELEENTPVRTDSTAALVIQGVTGTANVAITSGTPNAPLLREQGNGIPIIVANDSVLQTLSNEGPQMISRLNTVAEQLTVLLGQDNQTRVRNILGNVERSSANLDQALADVGTAADGIAALGSKLDDLSASADTMMKKITETAGNADATLASGTATLDELRGYVEGDLKSLTENLGQTAATLREDVPRVTNRLEQTLANLDPAIDIAKETLGSAARAFDGADRIINTEVGPVAADLRVTLGKANQAIDQLAADLPDISQSVRNAAESADTAFSGLRRIVEGAHAPVVAFTREGLPQYTRLAASLRSVADNVNELVSTLRRNPSRLISGPKTPEFRR